MSNLVPFAIFFIGAALAALTRGALRSAIMLLVPIVGAYNLWTMPAGDSYPLMLLGYKLQLMRLDSLSLLFGYLFHLAAFLSVIFALHVKDRKQDVAALVYAGSAIGAVMAGDLISFFVFWEILALSSVFFVLAQRSKHSYGAAMRYLIIQVASGVTLLAGILIHAKATGSIAFDLIGLKAMAAGLAGAADPAGLASLETLGSWLILIAIGIKCAFPLLHNWLTDAYPEATPTGTVFLSAFTTKVAVYALARGYAGTELLVYVGMVMALYPIFYAVIENDLRRVLSYSMMNQIGFMVCGIGIGTALAVNGAVSHAFNDVIFKGLLFMSMGAVMYRTGKTKASDLGGLFRTMPWTTGFCIIGALSISAVPLFSGFVSKSMVMAAAIEQGHPIVWLALVFASAGVVEHAGIKIPYFAFFAHDSGLRPKEAPWNMLLAMALAAAICIFIGVYPQLLYSYLPNPVDYLPYSSAHVMSQIQLLSFAVLAIVALHKSGLYPAEIPGRNIDAEWTYRKALPAVARWVTAMAALLRDAARKAAGPIAGKLDQALIRYHGPDGYLGRSLPTGSMAFWTIFLLGAYLLFSFI